MKNQNEQTQNPTTQIPADQTIEQASLEAIKKQNQLLKTILTLFVAIILVAAGVFGYAFYSQNYLLKQGEPKGIQQPEITTTPTVAPASDHAAPTATPIMQDTGKKESYSEDTNIPNQKRYVSPKLGISFLYLTTNDQGQFSVKEQGDTIYVFMSDTSFETGQFVQVFSKDKSLSLKDALTQRFLVGKDPARCFIEEMPLDTFPAGYEQAQISFPADLEFDMEKMQAKTDYCSKDYAKTNGMRFFVSDTKHPEKFVFFSIGQYGIYADSQKMWQDTIVFSD